jgi:hypothetical protein
MAGEKKESEEGTRTLVEERAMVQFFKIVWFSRPLKFGLEAVSLVQLIRFLMVELTYSDLNFRFNISVIFMTNYSFSERRRTHQQRGALGDRLYKF